jgi:uncharacterized protein YbjT (DUF2867 family)
VRVLGRDRGKLVRLFGAGFDIVSGDAMQPATLGPALEACDGVHVSLADGPGEDLGARTIVASAIERGVTRISYVSGTTVCEEHAWFPIVARKLAAERAVRDSGIPHVILRPSWFMEILANFILGDRAICIGSHPTPYHFMAADDFGGIVSRFYALERAPDATLQVHEPERLRLHDAIDRYRAALCPSIRRVTPLPFWLAAVVARLRGREGARMRRAVRFLRYFAAVGEGAPTPENDRWLGRATTGLDTWLDRQRALRAA